MKKYLYLTAASIAMLGLASCSEDDGPSVPDPDYPTVSEGAYVLNQGNFYNAVPGGLNVVDYNSSQTAKNVFEQVNGRSIGDTPQCGVAYGSKIYVGTMVSETIEVLNRNDYKSIKQIRLTEDGVDGTQPRCMIPHNGKIYMSMYDGYVARFDTLTMKFDKAVKVGPNPEIMALRDGKLYVPNSDGMNWAVGYGKTASIVDVESMTVTGTFEVPENPAEFYSGEDGLYLLCKGNYKPETDPDFSPSALYKVEKTVENGKEVYENDLIAKATIAALGNGVIYFVNQPFTNDVPKAEYYVYDMQSGKVSDWKVTAVDYPSNIAVDKVGGRILVSSYVMNGLYPSYDAPGYLNVYSTDNALVRKYEIGAGPTCIFFNTK